VTSSFPNQSIKDGFDVIHKIAKILAAVPNVAFKFRHIKGNQDYKRNPKQLSLLQNSILSAINMPQLS